MEATTLNTFFLRVPSHASTVELLGSWDNFARPYRLSRDLSRGKGIWAGCHRFDNIVFDGDKLDWSTPRNGPLKQGGRYWYFYRLDDSDEYCDPSRPTCSNCPLLPGQTLNLLDVPFELDSPPTRSHSASFDTAAGGQLVMTYDPSDRFKKLTRQPLGKLGRHYASTEDLRTVAQPDAPDQSGDKPNQSGPPESSPTKFGRLVRHVKSFTRPRTNNPTGRGTSPSKTARRPITPLSQLQTHTDRSRQSPSFTPILSPTTNHAYHSRPPSRSAINTDPVADYFVAQPSASPARHQGLGIISTCTAAPQLGEALRHKRSRNLAGPFYTSSERPPPIPSPCTPSIRPSRTSSGQDTSSTDQTANLPSPVSELGAFDVASPTFTDDTIDTPGFGTPHRLSGHFGIDSLSPGVFDLSFDMDTDAAVANVERRLSHLTTADDSADTIHLSPFVAHADATSSNHTLKKLATPGSKCASSPAQSAWLSSPSLYNDTSRSSPLANNIFGELGFLGRAIT